MTRAREFAPETLRELQRLDKLAHKAHTENDLVTEATCKQRWLDLYHTVDGRKSPAPAIILTEKQAERHRTADHVPEWRLRQKLSPLVAIVRVEEKRYMDQRGHLTNHWVEHLSCGHENIYYETWDYPERTKRRHCKTCGDAALIASGYVSDIAHHHTEPTENSTLSLYQTIPPLPLGRITLTAQGVTPEPAKPRVIEMPRPVVPVTDGSNRRDEAKETAAKCTSRG